MSFKNETARVKEIKVRKIVCVSQTSTFELHFSGVMRNIAKTFYCNFCKGHFCLYTLRNEKLSLSR